MATGFLTPRTSGSLMVNDASASRESFSDNLSLNVLASPLQAYKYENNRRYHAYREGSYWGPNDEQDACHQKVAHHLFNLVLQDRLYLAPIAQPQHVVDIGTGIGLWASNMSDAHPTSQILGTDLSPVWHSDALLRPNLSFEVDDCCSNWTYRDEGREPFDLIHIRSLYGSIKDWRRLYQQAFENLDPGRGWIEQVEISLVPKLLYTCGDEDGDQFFGPAVSPSCDSDGKGPIFHTWCQFWQECSKRTGKTWFVADQMATLIYEAGFENVHQRRFILPLFDCLVARLTEVARWFREFWETGMEGWVLAVSTRYMGWTAEKAKAFVMKTKEALDDQASRVYYELVVVYGQRPVLENET